MHSHNKGFSMTPEEIKHMIEAGLPDSQAMVHGDGHHFEAVIICDAFAGQTMIKQHRMVYAALGNAMESAIHALSMRTYTPQEWQSETNKNG
jgi:acid stress-induced BolA-like protein IbaG/YrbA